MRCQHVFILTWKTSTMVAHIRHLIAYKRFIEHIYTLGTVVNCLRIDEGSEAERIKRKQCRNRKHESVEASTDCKKKKAHRETPTYRKTPTHTAKEYWVKLKRKSLMRIFCLKCFTRGERNPESKIEMCSPSLCRMSWLTNCFSVCARNGMVI